MTIKAMVRGINGRLKIRCGMPGIGSAPPATLSAVTCV